MNENAVGEIITRPRMDGKGTEELRVVYACVGDYIRSDGKATEGITFIRVVPHRVQGGNRE